MLRLERCFTESYIPTETQPPSQIKNYHVHGETAKATFSQRSVRLTKNKTLNHWNKERELQKHTYTIQCSLQITELGFFLKPMPHVAPNFQ